VFLLITYIASEIGSGKSCYAALLAKRALKHGKTVYSSEHINGCLKVDLTDLVNLKPLENSLIILEEIGNSMNSRNFSKINMGLIEFFKLSRHYKSDIVLISQTFNDSDKQVRELSSKVCIIRPLIKGLFSMVVKCKGKLGIGLDGQFCVQYKIGHLGEIFFLPKYFKMFNSFNVPFKDYILSLPW